MTKHATSSALLLSPDGRLALIRHPKLGRWTIPGGHVETHENPAEAILREIHEETGMTARLLAAPTHGIPVPEWIVERTAGPEKREPTDHIHVDHVYVATANGPATIEPELPVRWVTVDELDALDMFDAVRDLAREYLTRQP